MWLAKQGTVKKRWQKACGIEFFSIFKPYLRNPIRNSIRDLDKKFTRQHEKERPASL